MEGMFVIFLYFQAGISLTEETVWIVSLVGVMELALRRVFPNLSLYKWSARWLSRYLEWSLVMLSLICCLVTSGESNFFRHLLGLWMSARACLLLMIFLIVPDPLTAFRMKSVVLLEVCSF